MAIGFHADLARIAAGQRSRRPAGPARDLLAAGALMVLLALVNSAFAAFLVYGLNRYAYYVTPFMAGAAGVLGALLFDWTRRIAARCLQGDLTMRVKRYADLLRKNHYTQRAS
jgi:hypothetical protein